MKDESKIQPIMKLIMHGGNAKGLAINAIKSARNNDFKMADKYLSECDSELNIAHRAQTDLLFDEARGVSSEITLMMVHGQDHIMNAITTRDLAFEIIECLKISKRGVLE